MTRLAEKKRVREGLKTGKSGTLVLWSSEHSLLPVQEVAREAGMHIGLVERLVEFGVIEPDVASSRLFAASAVDRLRCVMRLRRDLGVNLAGAAVILEMREQLRSLRAELERMRRRASFTAPKRRQKDGGGRAPLAVTS
jgi:DNA-binding transcriptional MerR regulator